jgi:hypothetical protein
MCVGDITSQGKFMLLFSVVWIENSEFRAIVIKPLCSMRRPRKPNAQIVLFSKMRIKGNEDKEAEEFKTNKRTQVD